MSQILILDGGLGTTLEQEHGVEFGPSEPLWSSHLVLSSPATLLACQRSFARVPVDVLLTATYQMSTEGLARTKTPEYPGGIRGEDAVLPIIDAAVDIACQAARRVSDAERDAAERDAAERDAAERDAGVKLALSIGPYGACMVPSTEYTGTYDPPHNDLDSLTDWHAERMRLFSNIRSLRSRISFLAIETIPRKDEITAVRRALGRVPELAGIPFWISSLYPTGHALPDGTSPEDAARAMLDPGTDGPVPWGIGINCTKVDKLDALVRRFEGEMERMRGGNAFANRGEMEDGDEKQEEAWPALVLYPDGTNGEVYNTQTKMWEVLQDGDGRARERGSWEEQLAGVVEGAATGRRWPVVVVGGCCMSRPADIARLRGVLSLSRTS